GEGQSDQRSDIYPLGVLLYHALTGHDVSSTPFRLPPLARLRPELPAALARLIARATALEPADRFANVAELAAALRQLAPAESAAQTPTQSPQVPARRRTGMPLWAFGVLLVAIVVLAGGLVLGRPTGAAPVPTPPASAAPAPTPPTGTTPGATPLPPTAAGVL